MRLDLRQNNVKLKMPTVGLLKWSESSQLSRKKVDAINSRSHLLDINGKVIRNKHIPGAQKLF